MSAPSRSSRTSWRRNSKSSNSKMTSPSNRFHRSPIPNSHWISSDSLSQDWLWEFHQPATLYLRINQIQRNPTKVSDINHLILFWCFFLDLSNQYEYDLIYAFLDKFANDQSHEVPEIYANILEHVPEWKVLSMDDIEVRRLNGNSNAVFKVSIKNDKHTEIQENRSLLYRRYE